MLNRFFKYLFQNQFILAIFIIAAAWFLFEIRSILIVLFISFILMATLSPLVNLLRKKRIPKTVAIILSFILTLTVLSLLVFAIMPFFIEQTQSLLKIFPDYLSRAIRFFGGNINLSQITSYINSEFSNIGQRAFNITSRVFSGVFSTIMIFVLSFYLLLYEENIKNGFSNLFSKNLRKKALFAFNQTEKTLSTWVVGQIILSIVVGFLTWIALTVLGLKFALPLAIMAGVLEIIPTVGPIIAALLAIIVALNVSTDMVIKVAVIFLFIQLLENNVLVPRIMQRVVGLNPIVVILGIIVGGQLMGLIGALLSIPFILILITILKSLKE